MLTGTILWTWFTVVDDKGYVEDFADAFELHCNVCGHEFDIDKQTRQNMAYIAGRWLPECPWCGRIGEN